MPDISFPTTPSVDQTYTFSGRTWVWNGIGWAAQPVSGGGGGGGGSFTESATAPSSPAIGDRWLDTDAGIEYTWISPGAWVDLATTGIDFDTFVQTTGAQSIAGVKTFTDSPVVPTPTTDMQAATKLYVDSAIVGYGQLAGHRNKVINGSGEVNQRALTSVADDTYFIDRFYVLTESGNVTVAQVTDPESGAPFGFRLTQPDATPKRIGWATIIESKNIRQYASGAMNFFCRVKLSAGTNIRYAIIEHTGTADVVTSDVVSNWASTTFTPSNFFIAGINILKTDVVTPGAATFGDIDDWSALSASVKNVILFVWTESTLAQNGTLEANRVQFEPGVVATPFEYRLSELQLCQRYFEETFSSVAGVAAAAGANWATPVYFKVQKRTTPTIAAGAAIAITNISGAVRDQISVHGFRYVVTATASGAFSGAGFATASAEL